MAGLKDRLGTLRRQAGQPVAESPVPTREPALAERLAKVRRVGQAATPTPRPQHKPDEAALAEQLGGERLGEGLILVERRYPLDGVHGRRPLAALAQTQRHPDHGEPLDPAGLLFFDTETTGLAGGTGTLAFLLGLARLDGEALRLRQYFLTGFAAEAAMLEAAGEWLAEAGALVSFNGRSFDAPLLTTRYRLAGQPDPLAGREHIDLLHPTRRAFGKRWPDCRLQTAERQLLGFHRVGDLPGAEVPEAWFEFVRFGFATRLPALLEHNRHDLLSLAVLLPALHEVSEAPAEAQADVLALARGRLRQGDESGAFALLRRYRDALASDGLLELARLHRRRGEWEAACELWQALAAQGCEAALEHLAKYHEHVRHDPVGAWGYARRLPVGADHQRRRERLQQKLSRDPFQG